MIREDLIIMVTGGVIIIKAKYYVLQRTLSLKVWSVEPVIIILEIADANFECSESRWKVFGRLKNASTHFRKIGLERKTSLVHILLSWYIKSQSVQPT